MAGKTNANYDINYNIGWAIVTNAFSPRTGKEMTPANMSDVIRKRMMADGRWNEHTGVRDQTAALEDWERRRTRKDFKRPEGMFIFRLVDRSGKQGFGEMEMTEWPQR